jgi:hypothetical protein
LNKFGEFTLDQDETKVLDDWVVYFQKKYRTVGVIKKVGISDEKLAQS